MRLKNDIILLVFVCCAFKAELQAQISPLYNDGMTALKKNDTAAALSCFKQSIGKYRDPASFNMLGNLQLKAGTYESRFLALDNFKEAVLRDPGNTKYRLDYANLLVQHNKKEGAVEYNNLIKIDDKNIDVWLALAENFKLRYDQGYEWGNYKDLYIDGASDNYTMAERCYLRAIRIDNMNFTANLGLAELYADHLDFDPAIMILTKLNIANPNILGINLRLGMWYCLTSQIKASHLFFNKAFSLMSEEERKAYTEYSIEMFLPAPIQKKLAASTPEEKRAYIDKYWSTKDPFFMTEENERIVEHYFRVAFSNLYFSSPAKGLAGWQSDRGKVLISFGGPDKMFSNRLSSVIKGEGLNFSHPIFWTYRGGMNFRFDTFGVDNYYWLSRLDEPQYGPGYYFSKMETSADRFQNNKEERFGWAELITVKKYTTPMQINVFKSLEPSNNNNVYFTYTLPLPKVSNKEEHDYCLTLHNESMDLEGRKTGKVKKDFIRKLTDELRPAYEKLNTISMDMTPGKHNFAFETRTTQDSLVSTMHRPFECPSFKKDSLDMSGLLLASKVREGSPILGAIKRNDIYILPKIGRQFENKESLFLYYEVYNLTRPTDGRTDFEHTMTIKEADPPELGIPIIKLFKGIAGLVTGKSDKISLTTSYKTEQKDSQVYMQLDISQYKPGNYEISVTVHDKLNGSKIERNWQFEIVDAAKTK